MAMTTAQKDRIDILWKSLVGGCSLVVTAAALWLASSVQELHGNVQGLQVDFASWKSQVGGQFDVIRKELQYITDRPPPRSRP